MSNKMMENNEYEKKYIKYNKKNEEIFKKFNLMNGGRIMRNDILLKIKSIGFEFETVALNPVYISQKNMTIGTPVVDFSKREKILLKKDDVFGEYIFEITPDYGLYKGNLQSSIELSTRKKFKIVNGSSIRLYDLIYYYRNHQQIANTEFIITFPIIYEEDDNIILNKMQEACRFIVEYMNSLKKIGNLEFYGDGNLLSNNMVLLVDDEQRIDVNGENVKLGFIFDKRYNYINMKFKPQITVGINLSSVIEVVSYFLMNSYYHNTILYENYLTFQKCVEDSRILVDEFYQFTLIDLEKKILLLNWMVLVLFHFENYSEYVKRSGSDSMYFKQFKPIVLRHLYSEILPLRSEEKELFFNFINSYQKDNLTMKYKIIKTEVFSYILSLTIGNENFIESVPNPDFSDSTLYKYNKDSQMILIEYRDFGHDFRHFMKSNYFYDSISLNEMIDLTKIDMTKIDFSTID